ncbi:MAG TPA: glycine--tRNA ligase subunit beta [Acidobacteria bacterium]|nr:glycine--tRNA ligase subunit beta [Acidobacteriota bacterium]
MSSTCSTRAVASASPSAPPTFFGCASSPSRSHGRTPGCRPRTMRMTRGDSGSGGELLIEIGCEEMPAGWLPRLTRDLARHLQQRLTEARVAASAPSACSTARRLVVTAEGVAAGQEDLEELVTGPPVSAGYKPDGTPTKAAAGFARKHGVEVAALVEVDTPKGRYLAHQRHEAGLPTIEVLPAVLAATLRDLTFPKQMQWDAQLDDGKGELPFGRPIRWLVFLLDGRIVPFTIGRTSAAEGADVAVVEASNVTFGHRFLGPGAGEPVTVHSIADHRAALAERYVVLDRAARLEKIRSALVARAEECGGAVDLASPTLAALVEEVPDLVEFPMVVAGGFDEAFLELPGEVLARTMIHHQHFFPVAARQNGLAPSFLAVTNTAPENAERVSRNAERVLAARLRDARFFWEADRKVPLESRFERLATVLFHKRLGSYREKSDRMEELAGWIARDVLGRDDARADARSAARLAKADLATEMVGEFAELQGVMGGIYAREQQLPEPVWQAIYHHYLPVSPEPTAAPAKADLGAGAVTWAAVALADKLDTIVGLFCAGERPTGSRDPFGLRRQAHGVFRILIDLPELTGVTARTSCSELLDAAARPFEAWRTDAQLSEAVVAFMLERLQYVLEQRGHDIRNIRAVTGAAGAAVRPLEARWKLEVLPEFTESSDFKQLAVAFKRVRNIACELSDADHEAAEAAGPDLGTVLTEDAERELVKEIEARQPVIDEVMASSQDFRLGFAEAAKFGPAVDRFFTDVFVMVDDPVVRTARLRLMKRLERLILQLGDISEIVADPEG